MGGGGSKEEKKEEKNETNTNNGNIESSSGFHIVEIHTPTAGLGLLTVIFLLVVTGGLWLLFRRMQGRCLGGRDRRRRDRDLEAGLPAQLMQPVQAAQPAQAVQPVQPAQAVLLVQPAQAVQPMVLPPMMLPPWMMQGAMPLQTWPGQAALANDRRFRDVTDLYPTAAPRRGPRRERSPATQHQDEHEETVGLAMSGGRPTAAASAGAASRAAQEWADNT